MTIITLQILTTFTVLLWFDLFRLHKLILHLFGFKPWTKKEALPFYLKWAACYFCTSFWIGVIVATAFYFQSHNWQLACLLIMSNTIMSRLLDYLLGYQSFKAS